MVEDQKKRALQALERRVAAAKAEGQGHGQGRGRGRGQGQGQVKRCRVDPSSNSEASFPKSSFKKDLESEDHLTYSTICLPLHQNLLTSVEESDKHKSVVDKILHDLLQKGDSAHKYIQGSRSKKLDNWILLDNLVQGNTASASHLQAFRETSKRSKKHMSMKQLKKCGLLDLPPELHKFELFMPMHVMWKEYMMQLLKNIGKNNVAQPLLAADLHGAILRVVDSKVDSFIGVVGIMIREIAETFVIITQESKFRVVPKRNSIFTFQADCWRITLHGDKCISRKLDTF